MSAEDIRALKAATESSTKAIEDLTAAVLKMIGGQTGGATAASGIGAAAMGIAGSPFWKDSGKLAVEKSDNAAGGSLTAMQQAIRSAGAGSASGVMGAALGAPTFGAGVMAAGAGAAVAIARDAFHPEAAAFEAGIESRASASAFRDPAYTEKMAGLESELAGIQKTRQSEIRQGFAGLQNMPGETHQQAEERWLRMMAARERSVRGRISALGDPEKDLEARAERLLAPFANAGIEPGDKQIERVLELTSMQSKASFQIHKDVQRLAPSFLMTPGRSSQQDKR